MRPATHGALEEALDGRTPSSGAGCNHLSATIAFKLQSCLTNTLIGARGSRNPAGQPSFADDAMCRELRRSLQLCHAALIVN